MSEQVNQNDRQPTQADRNSSDSDDILNFEQQSEEEMKALAKGLMVDLVWTLSGMNRESKKENQKKDSQSTN